MFRWPQITVVYKYRTADHRSLIFTESDLWWDEWSTVLLDVTVMHGYLLIRIDGPVRFEFEIFESDHQYESNLESDVRFEIESNHEASQVPNLPLGLM